MTRSARGAWLASAGTRSHAVSAACKLPEHLLQSPQEILDLAVIGPLLGQAGQPLRGRRRTAGRRTRLAPAAARTRAAGSRSRGPRTMPPAGPRGPGTRSAGEHASSSRQPISIQNGKVRRGQRATPPDQVDCDHDHRGSRDPPGQRSELLTRRSLAERGTTLDFSTSRS